MSVSKAVIPNRGAVSLYQGCRNNYNSLIFIPKNQPGVPPNIFFTK